MENTTEWLEVPESIAIGYDFVIKINEVKFRGGQVDHNTALAATAANELLRSYFERMTEAVNQGHFDPDHILTCVLSFDLELRDGEEESSD
jgi:hypothetical protein